MSTASDAPVGQDPRERERARERARQNTLIGRREAMRRGTITAGALVAASYGVSMPVAANNAINYGPDISPRPWAKVNEVEIRRHYGDYDELDFENDAGDVVNLTDEVGFVIPDEDPATRDEDDEEDKNAWNPFTLDPRNFFFSRNKDMPRDAEDDDDDPIHWHQSEWWSGDASVSEASLNSLEIQGNAGNTATFDGDGELEVTGSLGSIRLHLVLDVDDLDSTGEIHFKAGDGTNWVHAKVDPDGNTDNDEIIADSTGSSIHVEPRLGDINGNIDDIEEITEVEVEFVDAYGEVRIYGLDVERSGELVWGTREIKDDDDEFDSEDVKTPSGEFSITSLDTLPSMGEDEHVRHVKAEGEIRASELPEDQVDVSFEDAGRHASGGMTRRMRAIWNFNPDDSDFNVSWNDLGGLHDEVGHSSSNYLEVGYERDHDDIQDLSDWDDDDLDLTDVTSDYQDESLDEEVEVTSSVSSGEYTALAMDLRLTPEDAETLQVEPTVGPPDDEPRGLLDRVFTVPGAIISGLLSVGVLQWVRSRMAG